MLFYGKESDEKLSGKLLYTKQKPNTAPSLGLCDFQVVIQCKRIKRQTSSTTSPAPATFPSASDSSTDAPTVTSDAGGLVPEVPRPASPTCGPGNAQVQCPHVHHVHPPPPQSGSIFII